MDTVVHYTAIRNNELEAYKATHIGLENTVSSSK